MKGAPPKTCASCGARLVEYRHGLSRPLLDALRTLARAGGGPVNLRELRLSRSCWDNFQKLRYWDFVVQVGRRGVWQITDVGLDFLRGEAAAYRYTRTFRGARQAFEGPLVHVRDVVGWYEDRRGYAVNAIRLRPSGQLELVPTGGRAS